MIVNLLKADINQLKEEKEKDRDKKKSAFMRL
jgi:hypothetical protein